MGGEIRLLEREVRYCIVCGCELESEHWNAKYCVECRKRVNKQRQREYERKHRYSEKRQDLGKQVTVSMEASIERLAREAREAGVSYGKYIASRGIV